MSSRSAYWLMLSPRSEEPELVLGVGNQDTLGVAVVVEHHGVVLAADAGFLVAAKGRVSRVDVVAVHPHPAGLDTPREGLNLVHVAGPDPRAQAIEGVVGDFQGL